MKFFNRNAKIFLQVNALKNVVCKMAAILSRVQGVECILSYNHLMAYRYC